MKTRIAIAGFTIRRTTTNIVVRFLNARLRRRQQTVVFFANAHFVTTCEPLRVEIEKSRDLIVLNDGVVMDIAALLLFGTRFPENLCGTDFVPALLSRLDRESRLFLLGGRPDVAKTAAEVLGRFSPVRIAGYADGYSIWDDGAGILGQINRAKPDILLVALGNPLQEDWVLRNRADLEVPLILSVGALLDFAAGHTPRAPRVLRALRLEWLYRLALEPRRLTGRYTIGIVKFLAAAFLGRAGRRDGE